MVKTSGKDALKITSEAALAFIREMQKRFPKPPQTEAEKARLRAYLAKFPDPYLKAVGTRVQSDLMLRPPRTIEPKDFEKTDAAAVKPRASRRSRGASRAPKLGDRGRR